MAIAMPKAPTPPTPPVSPGLEQASGAVGGLPDFGASGQAAVEGVQQEARDAVRAGQEAAANARAAGERLAGTPERKNQNTEKQGPGDSKLPLNEAAGKDKAADGAGSRTTVQQPANLPQAAQGAPEGAAKTETKEASGLLPPDAHSSSAVMAYWTLLLIVCLAGVFLLARKLSSKKPGEPTPLERAAKEAELLAEIEAQRTAREKRQAERAAAVAAAGLAAIAGAKPAAAGAAAFAAAAVPPPASLAKAVDAAGSAPRAGGRYPSVRSQAGRRTANDAPVRAGAAPHPVPPAEEAPPAAGGMASLAQALSAFREAGRMLEEGRDRAAAEEVRQAERIASLQQEEAQGKDGKGNFEIRI